MLTHMLRAAEKARFISVASNARTTTGATLTINKPADTVEGDFLIVFLESDNSTSWTGDTGWTEIFDTNLRIAYKVATSSEGASYTFTAASASTALRGCILCYRGAAYDTIGTADTASPFTPAGITMSNFGILIGVIGRAGGSTQTLTLPASMTSRFNSSPSNSTLAVGDEIIQLGATGATRTFTSTNNNSVTALLVGLKTG